MEQDQEQAKTSLSRRHIGRRANGVESDSNIVMIEAYIWRKEAKANSIDTELANWWRSVYPSKDSMIFPELRWIGAKPRPIVWKQSMIPFGKKTSKTNKSTRLAYSSRCWTYYVLKASTSCEEVLVLRCVLDTPRPFVWLRLFQSIRGARIKIQLLVNRGPIECGIIATSQFYSFVLFHINY